MLLDLKLSPGGDAEGLAVCSRILERRPGTGVVVLFMGKLDVHHRAEVAYVASRLGLLEHA